MKELVIQSLWKEKRELRDECIMLQTGVQKAVLALLSVIGVFAGIVLAKESVISDASKNIACILLSQIQVYLGFFILSHYSNLNVHAKYIAVIEDRLNQFFEQKVHVWEEKICPNYLFGLKSSSLWTLIAITVLMCALFLGSLGMAMSVINKFLFGAIVMLELVALLGSIIHMVIEQNLFIPLFKKALADQPST